MKTFNTLATYQDNLPLQIKLSHCVKAHVYIISIAIAFPPSLLFALYFYLELNS